MHMDEVGDFFLGWFGLDIMKDDAGAAKAEAKPGK